jgi:hypothetical protein
LSRVWYYTAKGKKRQIGALAPDRFSIWLDLTGSCRQAGSFEPLPMARLSIRWWDFSQSCQVLEPNWPPG